MAKLTILFSLLISLSLVLAFRQEQIFSDKNKFVELNFQRSKDYELQKSSYTPPLPVVIWHGMGDSAHNKESMGKIADYITGELETDVFSIQIGKTENDDQYAGYFGFVPDQIQQVCDWIKTVPELQNGFNGVGFSQGGQFLRGLVESCDDIPQIKNLITMGGQHQGIMGTPNCKANPTSKDSYWCSAMNRFLQTGAYWSWVRNNVVQAQYYKNPKEYDKYLQYNKFLADINNEREAKIPKYKDNIQKLNKLVLVMFGDDNLVVPKESSWFGYYENDELVKMEDTALYKEDFIGLKYLNENQKLDTLTAPFQHMQFTLEWFTDNIINQYLK